jgi:hypothetical protein
VTRRLLVLTLLSLTAFIATGTSIPTGSGNDPHAERTQAERTEAERTFDVAQRYCPRGRC